MFSFGVNKRGIFCSMEVNKIMYGLFVLRRMFSGGLLVFFSFGVVPVEVFLSCR